MPTLTIQIVCELDGHPVFGSPFMVVLDVTEFQTLNIQKPVDAVGVFPQIPTLNTIDEVKAFMFTNPDAQVRYRIGSQPNTPPVGHIIIHQGGLIMGLNTGIHDGTQAISASNNDGSTPATILGFVAGDPS